MPDVENSLKVRPELVISAPVLVEVDYWVRAHLGPAVVIRLSDDISAGAYVVKELLREDYRRIRQLVDRYADSDIGFVDAAVRSVVERMGETKLATLDRRHFGMLRPRHVDALHLLPE